jgi:phosphatidate phosphatase APP1
MPNWGGISLVIIYGNAGQKQKEIYAELGAKFPSQFLEIPDEIEKLLRIE